MGVAGVRERDEVRPSLAAEFKGRPMGGKFNTLQETFDYLSIKNFKLFSQIQQFLGRPPSEISFWTPI
jgi:hypothetical protein